MADIQLSPSPELQIVDWTVDMEVNLFHAIRGHKPVGVNRFFNMMCIVERMNACHIQLSSREIWKHLSTMYDLNALNESEVIPFANTQQDFVLQEEEYTDLFSAEFPRASLTDLDKESLDDSSHSTSDTKTPKMSNKSPSGTTPASTADKRKRTRQASNTPNTTPDPPAVKRRR